MHKIVLAVFFSVLMFVAMASYCQNTGEEQLAQQYLKNAEFDKAAVLYEKLYDKKGDDLNFGNYLKSLVGLKNYDKAEKLCKKRIKKFPDQLKYLVDLGSVYEASGQTDKAAPQYEKAIKHLRNDQALIFELANSFIAMKKYGYAAEAYLAGRKMDQNYSYNFELAEVYSLNKEYLKMINEYLDVLLQSESYIQNIQNSLQTKLADDPSGNKNEILRTALLKHIQKYPDKTIFSEMLLWHYVQEKDFESALIQAKALDKRMKEDGTRIMSLATLCLSNEDYDAAIKAYQYIVSKGLNTPYYTSARVEMLNTGNKKLINNGTFSNEDLLQLETEYKNTIKELGRNPSTISLYKGLAHLQAFYLNKPEVAIITLTEIIDLHGIGKEIQAACKLELADIYLITGEVWESTLLYSQVDKAFKSTPLGEEAKFRNAKLSYYKGEFDWARAQLDVLKGGTSHLIANDALALSLLIQDNMGLDSNISALLIYSSADLALFQNKDDRALHLLDSLLETFPKHSLADEVLLKKAEIMKKRQNFAEAAVYLQAIVDQYPSDILGDDALYLLAELNEKKLNNKQKAMDLYQDLLVKYPGSTFAVMARKRFRILRGDFIN
jgi:tetratricopeptide (TPR) repeat protein